VRKKEISWEKRKEYQLSWYPLDYPELSIAGFSERLVVYAGRLKITVLIVVNMQNASN